MKPTKKQMALMDAMAQDREPDHYQFEGLEAMKTGMCNTNVPTWAKLAGISLGSAKGVFGTLVKAGWIELDEDNFRKNPSFSNYWDMSAFTEEGVKVYEANGGQWYEERYAGNA